MEEKEVIKQLEDEAMEELDKELENQEDGLEEEEEEVVAIRRVVKEEEVNAIAKEVGAIPPEVVIENVAEEPALLPTMFASDPVPDTIELDSRGRPKKPKVHARGRFQ